MSKIFSVFVCLVSFCNEYHPPPVGKTFYLPITILACLNYQLKAGETFSGWTIEQPFMLILPNDSQTNEIVPALISDSFFNGDCLFSPAAIYVPAPTLGTAP